MLAEARARIVRYTPADGSCRRGHPARRPAHARRARERDGVIPGSKHVPRSVLEWRADQTSRVARSASSQAGGSCLVCARGLLVVARRGDARRARRRRRRPRRRLRALGGRGLPGRMNIDRDRLVDTASRLIGVHSFTGDEERMAELMVALFDELGPAGAVAAGRGQPRERARHLGGRGRRPVADVQRAHGHVVLRPRAVAARRAGLPAAGVRARTAGSTGSASRT